MGNHACSYVSFCWCCNFRSCCKILSWPSFTSYCLPYLVVLLFMSVNDLINKSGLVVGSIWAKMAFCSKQYFVYCLWAGYWICDYLQAISGHASIVWYCYGRIIWQHSSVSIIAPLYHHRLKLTRKQYCIGRLPRGSTRYHLGHAATRICFWILACSCVRSYVVLACFLKFFHTILNRYSRWIGQHH